MDFLDRTASNGGRGAPKLSIILHCLALKLTKKIETGARVPYVTTSVSEMRRGGRVVECISLEN